MPLKDQFCTCSLRKIRCALGPIHASLLPGWLISSLTCSFLLPVATNSHPDPTEFISSCGLLKVYYGFRPSRLLRTHQWPSWESNDYTMYSLDRHDSGSRCPCSCRLTKSRSLPRDTFHVAIRQVHNAAVSGSSSAASVLEAKSLLLDQILYSCLDTRVVCRYVWQ